jgi:hypothetical protein
VVLRTDTHGVRGTHCTPTIAPVTLRMIESVMGDDAARSVFLFVVDSYSPAFHLSRLSPMRAVLARRIASIIR